MSERYHAANSTTRTGTEGTEEVAMEAQPSTCLTTFEYDEVILDKEDIFDIPDFDDEFELYEYAAEQHAEVEPVRESPNLTETETGAYCVNEMIRLMKQGFENRAMFNRRDLGILTHNTISKTCVPTILVMCNSGILGEDYRAPTRLISEDYRRTIQLDPYVSSYIGCIKTFRDGSVSFEGYSIPGEDEPFSVELFNKMPNMTCSAKIYQPSDNKMRYSICRATGHEDESHFHVDSVFTVNNVAYSSTTNAHTHEIHSYIMKKLSKLIDVNVTIDYDEHISDETALYLHNNGFPITEFQLSYYNPCVFYIMPRTTDVEITNFMDTVLSLKNFNLRGRSAIFEHITYIPDDFEYIDPLVMLFQDNEVYVERFIVTKLVESMTNYRKENLQRYTFTTDNDMNSIPMKDGLVCPNCSHQFLVHDVPSISQGCYCQPHAFIVALEVNQQRLSQNIGVIPEVAPGSKETVMHSRISLITPRYPGDIDNDDEHLIHAFHLYVFQIWYVTSVAFFHHAPFYKPHMIILNRRITASFINFWLTYNDGEAYERLTELLLATKSTIVDDFEDLVRLMSFLTMNCHRFYEATRLSEVCEILSSPLQEHHKNQLYNIPTIRRVRCLGHEGSLHLCEPCLIDEFEDASINRESDQPRDFMSPYSIPLRQRTENYSYMPCVWNHFSHTILDHPDPESLLNDEDRSALIEFQTRSRSDVRDINRTFRVPSRQVPTPEYIAAMQRGVGVIESDAFGSNNTMKGDSALEYVEVGFEVGAIDLNMIRESVLCFADAEKQDPFVSNHLNYGGWRNVDHNVIYTNEGYTSHHVISAYSGRNTTLLGHDHPAYHVSVLLTHIPLIQEIQLMNNTVSVDMGRVYVVIRTANFSDEHDRYVMNKVLNVMNQSGLQGHQMANYCESTKVAKSWELILSRVYHEVHVSKNIIRQQVKTKVNAASSKLIEGINEVKQKMNYRNGEADMPIPQEQFQPVQDPYFYEAEEEEIVEDLVVVGEPLTLNPPVQPAQPMAYVINVDEEGKIEEEEENAAPQLPPLHRCYVFKASVVCDLFSENGIMSQVPYKTTPGVIKISKPGKEYHVCLDLITVPVEIHDKFRNFKYIHKCECHKNDVEYRTLGRGWWIWDNVKHRIIKIFEWFKSLFRRRRMDDAYGVPKTWEGKGSIFKSRKDSLFMIREPVVFDRNECKDHCLYMALSRFLICLGETRKFKTFLSSTPGTNSSNPSHMAEIQRYANEYKICVYVGAADREGTAVLHYKFDDLEKPRDRVLYLMVVSDELGLKHWVYSIPPNSKMTYHIIHYFSEGYDSYMNLFTEIPEPLCLEELRKNMRLKIAMKDTDEKLYEAQAILSKYFNMQFPLMKKIEFAAPKDLIKDPKKAKELISKLKKEDTKPKEDKNKDKKPKCGDDEVFTEDYDVMSLSDARATRLKMLFREKMATCCSSPEMFKLKISSMTKEYRLTLEVIESRFPLFSSEVDDETNKRNIDAVNHAAYDKIMIVFRRYQEFFEHCNLLRMSFMYRSQKWPDQPDNMKTTQYSEFLHEVKYDDKSRRKQFEALMHFRRHKLLPPDTDPTKRKLKFKKAPELTEDAKEKKKEKSEDLGKDDPDEPEDTARDFSKTGDKDKGDSEWDDSSLSKEPKEKSDQDSSDDDDSEEEEESSEGPKEPVGYIPFSIVDDKNIFVFKNYVEGVDYKIVERADEYGYEFYDENKFAHAEFAIYKGTPESGKVKIEYMISSTHKNDAIDLLIKVLKAFAPKSVIGIFEKLKSSTKKEETKNFVLVDHEDYRTMIKLEADASNDPRSDLQKNTTLKTEDLVIGNFEKHVFRDLELEDIQEHWAKIDGMEPGDFIEQGQLKAKIRFTGITGGLDDMIERKAPEYLQQLRDYLEAGVVLATFAAPEWLTKLVSSEIIVTISSLLRDIVRLVCLRYFCNVRVEEVVDFEYYPQVVSHCMVQKIADDLKLDESRFDIAIQQAMRSHGRMMEPNSDRLTGTKIMCKARFKRKQEQSKEWRELLNPKTDVYGNIKIARGYSVADLDMEKIMKPTREMAAKTEIAAFISSYTKPYRKPAAFQLPGGSKYCCPYADSGESVNTLVGATHRLLNKKDKQYSEDTLLALEKAADYIYDQMPPFDGDDHTPLDEILKGKSGGAIKAYLEAADDYHDIETRDFYTIKAFSKWEPYDAIKHNRNIFPRSLEFRAMCLCYMYAAQKHFFKYIVNNIKGLDARGKEQKVAEFLDEFMAVMMSDYTSFESHATEEIMKRIEIPFLRKMVCGMPGGDKFMMMFSNVAELNEIIGHEFRAYVMARRQSGEVQTSWFNFLLNFCFIQAAFKTVTGRYVEKVLCEGDDLILSADRRDIAKVEKWLKNAGVDVKLETHDNLWRASFCGMHYTEDGRHVVDPVRAILRMGWANPQYMRSKRNVHEALMWMKATSCLYEHPSNPVTSVYCQRIIDYYCPNPSMLNRLASKLRVDQYTKTKIINSLNSVVKFEEPSLTQRLAVEELFNLSVDEQLILEKYIRDDFDPSTEFSHSIITERIDDIVMMYNENYVDDDLSSDNITSRPPIKVIEEIPGVNVFQDTRNKWRYYITSSASPLYLSRKFKNRPRDDMPPGLLDLWLENKGKWGL